MKKEDIKYIYSMSFLQEGMLFTKLLNENSNAYFEQITFSIKGNFDFELFKMSWNIIADRHDSLRTAFVFENVPKPVQIILKKRELEFHYNNSIKTDEQIEDYKLIDRKRGFNLQKDPLIRFAVFKYQNIHRIVWSFHHIIIDGWCNSILFSEFDHIYYSLINNYKINLPPAVQYNSYIKWLYQQNQERASKYWKNYLMDYNSLATLPKISNYHNKYELQKYEFSIDSDNIEKIRKLAQSHNITISNLIKTVWGILLSRYNNVSDVVFGTIVSGRQANIEGIEKIIGLFINTVPQRVKFSKTTTFSDLVKSIQKDVVTQGDYDYYSLAEIMSLTELKGMMFNQLLIFENYPMNQSESSISGLNFFDIEEFEQTSYDITTYISTNDNIKFKIKYNAYDYSENLFLNFGEHFNNILEEISNDCNILVQNINIFNHIQKEQLINEFCYSSIGSQEKYSIIDLFSEQVLKNPDKKIINFMNKSYSYSVRKNDIIGIMLNRSELLIISILGVLKAGCAYLPLPPDYPDERIKYIIEDSKTKLIITESSIDLNALSKYKNVKIFNLDSLEKKQFKSKRTFNIRPDDPAYLFYTSGSTGKPKGILNKHSAVTCFTENLKERFLIGDSDRIYAITTYAFDISILELICALLNSTSVTIAPDLANSDPKYFAEDILKNQITVLQITPSRLNALIDSIGIEFLKNIRTILIGGERFPDVLQLKLNKLHNTNIFNVYGPTETTIWSSAKKVSGKSINIGKPLINESMYILDDELKLIPIGAVGEICIGGTGLSLGYWENEELTKLRFINDPYNNNKIIFRTGDYGKFNFEGEIEFIGRKDEQIKIRGYRVELKEIEHAIESYSSIQSSIVIPIYQTSDDLFLVAFIISKIIPDINEIHKFLSKTLPYYMLPSDYFFIDSFPITANGKINKAELLDYYNSKAKKTNENPNFTELQERVREIWKSILNIENIQLNDKFIKLGGHSLKAIRLLSAFNKEFKTNITIKDFFIEPTILGMEKFLVPEINFEEIKIPVSVKKKFYNLTPSQKRLWVISQDDTASSAYNMPVAYKMRGKLNLDYLDKSINLLIQKFEILRTSFELIDDDPKQLIYDNITMNIEIINTSKEMVKELINKNIKYSFDLTSPPLFRVTLFRLDDEEYIFLFNIHHIISDAWSQELIFNEIIKNYNNLKSNSVTTLEIPEIQYKDYAEWKLNLKNGNKFKEDRNYWLKRFEEIPESLDLPNDKTRKLIKSFNGAIETLHISAKNFENINHFIQTNNLSPFSFYSGLIFLLLYKYTSQYDIVLGTVFAGRDFHQTHDQIGIFSNTIPLRLKINKNDFVIDCFNKIKANIFEDFLHQEFDYNELLKN